MAETIEKIAQPAVVPTESVLVDGIAYDTPAPVAAELLRLHIEAQQAEPAAVPDYKVYAVIDSMGWDLDDAEKDDMYRLCRAMLSSAPAAPADAMAKDADRYRDALSKIKSLVCGETLPNWSNEAMTYSTRGFIADIIDAAMAASREGGAA